MPVRWTTLISPSLGPLLARFAEADQVIFEKFRLTMFEATHDLADELQKATPRGKGSLQGNHQRLADAWFVADEGFQFRLMNTEGEKLFYVVKGNDYPHSGGGGDGYIYPVRSQFLRFEIDGAIIFARRVRASPPNDFVTPIVKAWKVGATAMFGTTVHSAARWVKTGL